MAQDPFTVKFIRPYLGYLTMPYRRQWLIFGSDDAWNRTVWVRVYHKYKQRESFWLNLLDNSEQS